MKGDIRNFMIKLDKDTTHMDQEKVTDERQPTKQKNPGSSTLPIAIEKATPVVKTSSC